MQCTASSTSLQQCAYPSCSNFKRMYIRCTQGPLSRDMSRHGQTSSAGVRGAAASANCYQRAPRVTGADAASQTAPRQSAKIASDFYRRVCTCDPARFQAGGLHSEHCEGPPSAWRGAANCRVRAAGMLNHRTRDASRHAISPQDTEERTGIDKHSKPISSETTCLHKALAWPTCTHTRYSVFVARVYDSP